MIERRICYLRRREEKRKEREEKRREEKRREWESRRWKSRIDEREDAVVCEIKYSKTMSYKIRAIVL